MDAANEPMTVPKKEQNAGVTLLLERMKTNPEEFVGEGNPYLATETQTKWSALIAQHIHHLEPEDQDALKSAINKLNQQRFTEKVLEELIDPKEGNLKKLLQAKLDNNGAVSGTITVGRLHNYT